MSIVVISDRGAKALMLMAAFWAFVLCFIILTDIIGRGVFNAPLHGTKEIVANSIVMIVFLQAGYAIRSRSMLRADFLVNTMPTGVQKAMLLIGYLLGAAFFLIMITGGWDLAVRSFVNNEFEGEGALRVPVWPTRWMILVGGTLALINYLVLAWLDVFAHEDVRLEDEAR
jgi:TRAP-type C4-dicarboxylate transport system permease small subunit